MNYRFAESSLMALALLAITGTSAAGQDSTLANGDSLKERTAEMSLAMAGGFACVLVPAGGGADTVFMEADNVVPGPSNGTVTFDGGNVHTVETRTLLLGPPMILATPTGMGMRWGLGFTAVEGRHWRDPDYRWRVRLQIYQPMLHEYLGVCRR